QKARDWLAACLRCFGELRDESGQALVIGALSLVVLMGALGLAIDGGQLRYQKRQMQLAADAAALAAALEVSTCGTTTNCSAMQTAAKNALAENGFTSSSLLTNCASRTGVTLELTVSNPPCALPGDPNYGQSGYVEVIVSEPVPTVFARVLGISKVPIMARSEAAPTGTSNCVYALDPASSSAVAVDVGAAVSSSCGIVVESTSSNALQCILGSISARSITVSGGVYSAWCSMNPTPATRAAAPSPADPLSSLTKPAVPACGSSTRSPYNGSNGALTITGTATLSPAYAYCGGITIKSGANVTLQPGTYVLTSKSGVGGLSIDVGATVNGTGVTFYNDGPVGGVTMSRSTTTAGAVTLVAPTTGVYAGILFFQHPQDTAQATLIGTAAWNTVLEGAYYFPKAKVVTAFSGAANYNILVAYDIEFASLNGANVSSTSVFTSNYSSLTNGSPLGNGAGAAVVQ
ncbi:MAG: hypothetical protein INR62_12600, partial [Rhodospirillales bacterium]|nr:hypothetical protein [Acetobacter sp.]